MIIPINFACEDDLSEFAMTKLVNSFGSKYYIGNLFNGGGFGYLKKNINGFNEASIATPFFVLTDLDDSICPINLINEWLKHPRKPNLIFRVAVREVEAWILADIEGFSHFLGISPTHFPPDPETIADPKALLINLARRSRKRDVREDIVPVNANAKVGPDYNGRLMEFVLGDWDISRAKGRSLSLRRAANCLEKFNYIIPSPSK